MTTRTDDSVSPLIESRADLLSVFSRGEKTPDRWRIGTEHEKFVYRTSDHRAPSYDEPGGIRDLLMGLTEYGWEPVIENGNVFVDTSTVVLGPPRGADTSDEPPQGPVCVAPG